MYCEQVTPGVEPGDSEQVKLGVEPGDSEQVPPGVEPGYYRSHRGWIQGILYTQGVHCRTIESH